MKRILFAIYDKFSHDQRALETIKSLSNIGEVTVVSYDKVDNWDKIKFIVSDNGKRNYLQFKKSLKKTYKKLKPDIVFLHDNYAAFFIHEAMRTLNNADENTDLNLVLKVINENNSIPVIVMDSEFGRILSASGLFIIFLP